MGFRRIRPVLTGALALAVLISGGKQAVAVTCRVEKPPAVTVRVETADIVYDFAQTAQALAALRGDTRSPYPAGVDSVSGGLRKMTPKITTLFSWSLTEWPAKKTGCLTYKTVDVTIRMDPQIYVAREFNTDVCRNAILQHERKHVAVDRQVMNKYAGSMGRAIQQAVDKAGAIGPFALGRAQEMQDISGRHVEKALEEQISLMEQEMHRRQEKVDSLEEYEYVSSFCRDVKFPR